ncbi:MAG: CoB--CoM heterodisulfide reductase iron-sulfur subunit B family protein [Promethearchaeota archaeon]
MNIAKKRVKLFTGCVIPNRLPFLEKSARLVFEKLGFHLEDAPFTCCPDPIGVAAISEKTWLTLAARNLSLGEEDNTEILSLCNGCTETLLMAKQTLKNNKRKLEETKEILEKKGYKYNGKAKVNHFIKVLLEDIGVDKIKKIVEDTWAGDKEKRNPIKDLKIATHPGCHYNRPSEVLKWDDPNDPQYLENLIKAIGGIPVKYEEKTLCCGSAASRTKKNITYEMCRRKYQGVTDTGAQLLAVNCPSCFQTLESSQRQVNKIYEKNYSIPIFYITELMALAFGYKSDELGIKYHTVGKEMDFLK